MMKSECVSYVGLYDDFSDSKEEICDSAISGGRDGVNDGIIDDQDTVEADKNSLDEDKR
jgi:hypothetical protein